MGDKELIDHRYTFLLSFKVVDANYVVLKTGQMRCNNQPDERSAKASLENLLRKKYPTAKRIIFFGKVINETLEQQGNDVLALLKRNKAARRK
jgi:hypothetical protein